ncbi:GntR family transcriptional regulator [Oceanobacillus damuensis]|uniref:GntR family transcriptional regulator n=1 Tax=Oceanobacillus damuensis TaxID=937928 RepID=UPI00083748FA|nr:GntR family transcriptional regulator [Oceanobacillus damuensis]
MAEEMNLRLGNREMLPNSVSSILRQAILKGVFKPGERLVQTELAEQIGVSRMPVREALKTLELEGLVTLEPHKGAVVRSITVEDVEEIYELRSVIESLVLKKSIPNLNEENVRALNEMHIQMLKTTDKETYVDLNRRFHSLLYSGCDSDRLKSFMETISHGLAQDTPHIIPGQIEKSNMEHEKILEAISSKNIKKAREELEYHIKRTGKELIKFMKEENKG